MTIFLALETDGVPAPSEFELEALDRRINWPGFDVFPTTRCWFGFYVQYKGIDHIRPYFAEYVAAECPPPRVGEKRIYTIARWDDLLMMYGAQQLAADARDEDETQADARYAGCP